MNEELGRENAFLSILKSNPNNKEGSLLRFSKLPDKFQLLLNNKRINQNLEEVLSEVDDDLIILCHYLSTAIILWKTLSRSKKRIFVHCHGHDVTWNRRVEILPILPAHGLFYKNKARKLIGKVGLIANSYCTKNKLVEFGYPESSIKVNYLSVDTDILTPNSKARNVKLRLLYLGRLTDFKGPLETIKAFELALEMGVEAHLDVVGDGPLMKKCLKAYNKSPHKNSISIHGSANRKEAIDYFSNADIFMAHNKTSLKTGQEEAFGVSIIEAMAFGLPVISGASGGVIETVINNETGLLFKPGDLLAHANAIFKLYKDDELRNKLGFCGRNRAVEVFSTKRNKNALKNILKITTC